jgi:hypothetical protein
MLPALQRGGRSLQYGSRSTGSVSDLNGERLSDLGLPLVPAG